MYLTDCVEPVPTGANAEYHGESSVVQARRRVHVADDFERVATGRGRLRNCFARLQARIAEPTNFIRLAKGIAVPIHRRRLFKWYDGRAEWLVSRLPVKGRRGSSPVARRR